MMSNTEEIATAIKLLDLIQRRGNDMISAVNDPYLRKAQDERAEAVSKLIKMNHLLYAIIRELS